MDKGFMPCQSFLKFQKVREQIPAFDTAGVECIQVKSYKCLLILVLTFLNSVRTKLVFVHWFTSVFCLIFLFILSRMCLLILPVLGFAVLINLQLILCGKSFLWSLMLRKGVLSLQTFILSSISRLFEISAASLFALSSAV